VPEGEVLKMERGAILAGRRRNGGQHVKRAECYAVRLTEDVQIPCSHSVLDLRQAQAPPGLRFSEGTERRTGSPDAQAEADGQSDSPDLPATGRGGGAILFHYPLVIRIEFR
jgi:hypothetical protein